VRPYRLGLVAGGLVLNLCVPGIVNADSVEVRTRVIPSQTIVHDQVELRVEVMHPTWARPRWNAPTFEGFWPERLSTRGETVQGTPVQLRRTVFRRALFPTRSGTLGIAASTLSYEEPDGTRRTISVPGSIVRASPVPEDGQPPGFADLVGRLELHASLVRTPVKEGESVQLLVEAYGEANLWDLARPDLAHRLGSDVEVFPSRPRLHRGEHGDRLTLRRTFVWDLVPLRQGFIDIPSLEISYFDSRERGYRIARSEPLRLEVVRRAADLGSRSPFERRPPSAPSRRIGAGALVLLALSAGGAVLFLVRWYRRNAERLRRPTRPSRRAALKAATAAIGTADFPRLLDRAVRAGIASRHNIDAEGLTTEEIGRRVEDPEAAAILDSLDRIRFAGDAAPAESLLASVTRYLEE
jgi:hypothetical protein